MAFSKYDPMRREEDPEGSSPAATRRANLLRWGNLITLLMTVLGFVLIAYWLVRGR